MRFWKAMGLRQKVLILSTVSLIAMFMVFAFIGLSAMEDSTDQTLAERLAVAKGAAHSLDFMVDQTCQQLERASVELASQMEKDRGVSASEGLAYASSYITVPVHYLALLDANGQALATESSTLDPNTPPYPQATYLKKALGGELAVSDVPSDPDSQYPLLSIASPLKDSSGHTTGALVASINLADPAVLRLVQVAELGKTGYAEIINSRGIAVASTRSATVPQEQAHESWFTGLLTSKQSAVSTCHSCHQEAGKRIVREDEIIVFAPLTQSPAPLGISIRQSQEEALAPTQNLRERLIILGGVSLFVVLIMAFVTTQSFVNPIKALTRSSKRIAEGNLEDSVPLVGGGEIQTLSETLDGMRLRLRQSIDEIKEKDRIRSELLRRLISAQEDERRRVARELHDETSQALTSISATLQAATTQLPGDSPARPRLKRVQDLVLQALDGIYRLVRDLRPALLDDMGLLMAVKSYAEDRFEPLGIKLHWETAGTEHALPGDVQVALFRVIQEALTNIAHHSGAKIASISIEFKEDAVAVEIEDDGNGFDVQAALASKEAWGLYGMTERIELLGGTIRVVSNISEGTIINIEISVSQER